MKISELLEASIPFHIKYGLQGFDPNNELHQQFQNVASDRIRTMARRAGQPIKIDIPKLWSIINQQGWKSALSGKAFTSEDPLGAYRKDLTQGFTTDNLQFINSSELKALGYERLADTHLSGLGTLEGYDNNNLLHAKWMKVFKFTKNNVISGQKAPFNISPDQAWDLINDQKWKSAISGTVFTDNGPNSLSLTTINKSLGWDINNVQYITQAENHGSGAQYVHTLVGFDKSNPLHNFFIRNYRLAKQRAGDNIEFFSPEQAWDIINKQRWKCALTGVNFNRTNQRDPLAPSPDQINPMKGYTVDNVQYVTWLVNVSKSNLNNEQYKLLCKAVVDHANGKSKDLGDRQEDPYSDPDNRIQVRKGDKTFTRARVSTEYAGINPANPLHQKLRTLWYGAKLTPSTLQHGSSRRKEMTRELSMEDCLNKANAQDWKCALTGVYLTTSGPNMISIDRVNPNGGYTPDNIQFTTWIANRAKTDMSNDEFVKLCAQVAK